MWSTIPRSSTQTLARCAKQFIADTRGATATTYAMILTVVVAIGSVLAVGIGPVTQKIFERLGENPHEAIFAATAGGPKPISNPSSIAPTSGASRNTAWIVALSLLTAAGLAVITLGLRLPHLNRRAPRQADDVGHEDDAMPVSFQSRILAKRQIIYQILDANDQLLSENRVEVRHVMTRDPVSVSPDVTTREVARRMAELRVRHLLVCEHSKLIGVISDRDLHTRSGVVARDIMTRNPQTVAPSTPVGLAVTLLMSRGFSCLPVLEGDRVSGLLTSTDLMMTLQCLLRITEQIARNIRRDPNGQPVTTDAPPRDSSDVAA